MKAWDDWFRSLGSSLIDRGNPIVARRAIGSCGPGTELGGYTVFETDSFENAAAIAADCPFMEGDGGVEIGELTIINRGTELAD